MKIKVGNDREMYLHKTLYANLEILKHATLKHDWDTMILVDGRVGSGKSTVAMQLASYFDPRFNLDNVAWTGDAFEKLVIAAKRFQSIVFDEAIEGLSSREFYTYINRTLIKLLTKIRHKSLFIVIVLPSFFDLEKGLAIYRSSLLLHCYTDRMRRGQYTFFSYDRKKQLYVEGKRFMNYKTVKANFLGDFTKFFPFDYKEYETRKIASYTEKPAKDPDTDRAKLRREEFISFLLYNLKKEGFTTKQLVDLGNKVYNNRTINDFIQKARSFLGKAGFEQA